VKSRSLDPVTSACCTIFVRYAPAVAREERNEGLKQRLSRQSEEALGRVAEELAANSVVSSALAGAFEARERAVAAQEAAMGALGIPSAADIERLTRRVRSVSQRLEGIEDSLDRLDDRLAAVTAAGNGGATDDAVERRLDELKADIGALREALDPAAQPVPRTQERLAVSEAAAPQPKQRRPSSSRSGARKASPRGSTSRKTGSHGARSAGTTSPGAGSGR
jgi:chromosome segregation ATPase